MSAPKTEITGRGVVSALGSTIADFEAALLSGACGIGDISDIAPGLKFTNGAPVRDFDPAAHFDKQTQGHIDRYTQMAAVAARQAWKEAGLDENPPEPARVGVVIGTANTGIDATARAFRKIFIDELRPSPFTIPQIMGSAPASRVARELCAKGPVFGVTSACASAGHAMLVGEGLIRAGIIDVAVVGGTDSCFELGLLKAWEALRVVSSDTCRPFSLGRKGLIMGEGAGMLVLERAGRASARKTRVFGRWLGSGMSSDAGDIVAPDPEGMKAAIRAGLADAGIAPDAVGYVNAHGTGTAFNDKCESAAVLDVFAGRSAPIPISATKSQVGHAMGAAGAIETIATLAALNAGILPPTLNFLEPDPDCPVDAVTEGPRPAKIDVAIKNSFAFGGLNLSIVLGRGD
ncbi:beta-ketoacyl-[acyl-carrier-protein] synthase family protein [Pinisolibacter aquiterrae]|uniref:beta-ketoacyl-[acyl-carrier-protein] synthase family protein n=1 Tax=Pinisolibacter aquiterrae TaxID=2815579 RepID=UPI001C3D1267|nr:beta-ketoacyl-[acyl-carrier-protein] synthase family protein [Pinisolibacter aquiterrae]MBV5264146.1 beta-ketoacyl-[acyl-carrier-protein] synthase family protein [Pinisolibacter aquiterrae]MCC8233760.1 beta-ketoacyl-[acyl-carrier-protein] synthase family protein [Pinisolibacter aquiterrae]